LCECSREDCISELTTKRLNEKTYDCEQCGTQFNCYQSRWRHRKVCKVRDQTEEINNLKNEIIELKKKIECNGVSYTTNNTTTNNIVNNINVVNIRNFGDEDISHLPGEFLSNCLLNPSKGITSLIEYIHYNEDMPCNYNLRFKSWKKNLFEKCMHGEWKECDASNTLDELIRKGYRILNAHYTETLLNDPDITTNSSRMYECFRFLGDKKCQQYHNVKRDLRLLVKDKTMFVLASPELE